MDESINPKPALASLNAEQCALLEAWLLHENLPVDTVCEKLLHEFALTVTLEDIEVWKRVRIHEQQIRKLHDYTLEAHKIIGQFRDNPENNYEKIIERIGQHLFDLMKFDEKTVPLKDVEDVLKLVVSVQALRLKQREMALEEVKYSIQAAEQRLESEEELSNLKAPGGIGPENMEKFLEALRSN